VFYQVIDNKIWRWEQMKQEKNALSYLFTQIWTHSQGNRKMVVWYWIMFLTANTFNMFAQPFLLAKIIDVVQKEGVKSSNLNVLFGLLGLTVLADLLFWFLHGPARCIERNNAFSVRMNYRKYLLKGIFTLPMDWHTEHHSGDTVDKIEKGTNSIYAFSENSFQVIYGIIQLVVSYGVLVYFSRPAAAIVLIMIIVSCWITVRFDRIMVPQYNALNRAENNIAESIYDAICNISTVIILRVEKLVFSSITHKLEKPFDLFKRNQLLSEFKWFLVNMCCSVMTVLVLGVYFWQNKDLPQGIMIGSLFLLTKYLGKISELFFRFIDLYSSVVKYRTRMTNAEELSRDFITENFTNHVLPPHWKKLTIENLNFSYKVEGNGELNLEGVSLSLSRGERIALVGESGSGKTTLLKIMRDLYHPGSLTLSVDGVHIPQGFEGISRAISLVPQNPEIFSTTILANITMGTEYNLDIVRKFTDMACFTETADSLPKRFESAIKEKGVNLSGGQQQRLALSRGLLACSDKDIVLLDEPTSSLDTKNEMQIYQNIFQGFKGKTIVSSIHRLHLLPLFDTIYFFGKGKIVASGSLAHLLTNSPEFQKLWVEYTRHSS
jgi:ATP-binding cassette, subfamily B, bacterial